MVGRDKVRPSESTTEGSEELLVRQDVIEPNSFVHGHINDPVRIAVADEESLGLGHLRITGVSHEDNTACRFAENCRYGARWSLE